MSNPISAVYPGTFDPITKGHLDILSRASKLFSHIVIAIADNSSSKNVTFPTQTRQKLVETAIEECQSLGMIAKDVVIEIKLLSEMLVDFARKQGCSVIVRGLRTISDFDHEFQLASVNRKLASDIETILLVTSEKHNFISSSLVKNIASLQGDISSMVTDKTAEFLTAFYRKS